MACSDFGSDAKKHRSCSIRLLSSFESGTDLKMHDFDSAPFLRQILRDQAPMTMMRLVFTAQQAAVLKKVAPRGVFDFAGLHQANELVFVDRPSAFVFFERGQNV